MLLLVLLLLLLVLVGFATISLFVTALRVAAFTGDELLDELSFVVLVVVVVLGESGFRVSSRQFFSSCCTFRLFT